MAIASITAFAQAFVAGGERRLPDALAATPIARSAQAGGARPGDAPAEAGRGAISGVIIDATTGHPLPGAFVYLGPPEHGPPGGPLRQITDPKGRFLFTDLPAFDGYFLIASRPGYAQVRYGAGTSSTRIALREGEWFQKADVALVRPAVISGRVANERGDPVVNTYVRVLTRLFVGGRSHLVAGPVARTDDRGEYRIAGLDFGRYLVQVPSAQHAMPTRAAPRAPDAQIESQLGLPSRSIGAFRDGDNQRLVSAFVPEVPPIDGRPTAYPATFHPGTEDLADATWIDVALGAERTGVDVRLRPVVTRRVAGRVVAPPPAFRNLLLRLLPRGLEALGTGSEAADALVDADGRFAFLGVPAGTYTLEAVRSPLEYAMRPLSGGLDALPAARIPNVYSTTSGGNVQSGPPGLMYRMFTSSEVPDEIWWGRMEITVGPVDIDGLALPMQRAATFSGTMTWDAGLVDSPELPGLVRLEPADGDPRLGMARSIRGPEPGTIAIPGLLAGSYVLSVPGALVRSVTWNGRDLTNQPIDASAGTDISGVIVTLTTEAAVFSGTARDAQRGAADAHAVIVYPAERSQWSGFGFTPARLKSSPTTTGGSFEVRNLPQGEYLAVCVPLEDGDRWRDPAFLAAAAPLATPVSLRWGQTTTRDLQAVSIR